MRKAIGIGGFGAIAIVLMFVLSGVPMVGATDINTPYYAKFSLLAGKKEIGATVEITHNDDNFFVKYTTTGDWWISETHVGVSFQDECGDGADPTDIPAKNGNPSPGKFQYKASHDPMVQTYTYEIPFPEGFAFDEDYVCLATHAVVNKVVGGIVKESQTGWAGDHGFSGKNWALFFCYQPGEPHKILTLPSGSYSLTFSLDESDSYWDVTGGLPSTLTSKYPTDGEAWCIETGEFLTSSGSYEMISSLEVPSGFSIHNYALDDKSILQGQMNEINWILNKYHDNPGTYSWLDIQQAIWWITGAIPGKVTSPAKTYNYFSDLTSNAQWLVNNADDDFLPMHGDWVAVILHSDTQQDLILEVDP